MRLCSLIHLILMVLVVVSSTTVSAARVEVVVSTGRAGQSIFMAGYYGDRVVVTDSTSLNAALTAAFAMPKEAGIYTVTIPGLFRFDFLIDRPTGDLRINAGRTVTVSGDAQTEAYAAWQAMWDTLTEQQAATRRDSLIRRFPGSLLAACIGMSRPLEADTALSTPSMQQMMRRYYHRSRHFFDHIDLSDGRLLHTPLYNETLRYFFSSFVTQQSDTLIAISWNLLQKSSNNYASFFWVSDFLMDYSLRRPVEGIGRLYRFLRGNVCMLSEEGLSKLPPAGRRMQFRLTEAAVLQALVDSLHHDRAQDAFVKGEMPRYRVLYFWNPSCPRCTAEAARWQHIIDRHRSKSCTGTAIDVSGQNARLKNTTCLGQSIHTAPMTRLFLTNGYAKTIVTTADGTILGVFGSLTALDEYLTKVGK